MGSVDGCWKQGHSEKSWGSREVLSDEWKANISPIFLKGHKDGAKSYRLVSPTSIPGEIVEWILLEHICGHLQEKEVLGNIQHGFIRAKSCLDNLLAFWVKKIRFVGEGRAMSAIDLKVSFQHWCPEYPGFQAGMLMDK